MSKCENSSYDKSIIRINARNRLAMETSRFVNCHSNSLDRLGLFDFLIQPKQFQKQLFRFERFCNNNNNNDERVADDKKIIIIIIYSFTELNGKWRIISLHVTLSKRSLYNVVQIKCRRCIC